MILRDETQGRELLVEYGRRLLADGLVQGTWGNISVRLDDQYMICTPSGLDYDRVGPEDMVLVDFHTLKYEGNRKPTSEKGLHAGIYDMRPYPFQVLLHLRGGGDAAGSGGSGACFRSGSRT